MLLQDTNRLSEAEPLMVRAVEIADTSLVEGHPWRVTFRQNLELLRSEVERASSEYGDV